MKWNSAPYPAKNADVVVRVTTGGLVSGGAAMLEISTDGGKTFAAPAPAAPQVAISDGDETTGATLVFNEGAVLDEGAAYAFAVRWPVGPVYRIGDAASPLPAVEELASGVLAGAELVLQVVKGGDRNVGTYRLFGDGMGRKIHHSAGKLALHRRRHAAESGVAGEQRNPGNGD